MPAHINSRFNKVMKWAQLIILGVVIFGIIQPAVVFGVEEPTYSSEVLPFDPKTGDKGMTSITEVTLGVNDPVTVTYRIINVALTFLGLAFLLVLVYAGTLWAIARGNEEQIEKAKKLIKRSLIGLLIILGSFGIAMITFYITAYATYGSNAVNIGGPFDLMRQFL